MWLSILGMTHLNRLTAASPVVFALSVLVVACDSGAGVEPGADEDEPQSPYSIERDLMDTVAGECPNRSALGSFHGDFAQDGDRLVFTGSWTGSGGSGPMRWEGTIDEANAFSLQLTAHPFTGEFDYQIWTADGSFNANRSSVTGTERFRGTFTSGQFCDGIISWTGGRS